MTTHQTVAQIVAGIEYVSAKMESTVVKNAHGL